MCLHILFPFIGFLFAGLFQSLAGGDKSILRVGGDKSILIHELDPGGDKSILASGVITTGGQGMDNITEFGFNFGLENQGISGYAQAELSEDPGTIVNANFRANIKVEDYGKYEVQPKMIVELGGGLGTAIITGPIEVVEVQPS